MYDLSFRRQAELARQQLQEAIGIGKIPPAAPMQTPAAMGAPPAPMGTPPMPGGPPPMGGLAQGAQPSPLANPGVTPQQQGAMSSLTAALNQRGAGMPKSGGPLMPNFKRGGVVDVAQLAVKFKEH